ncbi:MAG: hypothetical protein ACI9SP_004018 [Arenicella sp.]|jgi:hypothetical protein
MRHLILICILVLGSYPSNSIGHQQKEAYISLLFNPRTGNIEVSHRFLLHDAEHGLGLVLDGAGDLSVDPLTQQKFSQYVQQHFAVATDDNEPIVLESVGYEVEGKYFWVYQEAKIPNTETLKLRHSALHELWPTQTNHINVEKDGWVKSVRLQKENDSGWHAIDLD